MGALKAFKQNGESELHVKLYVAQSASIYNLNLVFLGALLIAIPVIVAMLFLNIGVGIITRAAPSLNIFAIGFPAFLFGGFLLLLRESSCRSFKVKIKAISRRYFIFSIKHQI